MCQQDAFACRVRQRPAGMGRAGLIGAFAGFASDMWARLSCITSITRLTFATCTVNPCSRIRPQGTLAHVPSCQYCLHNPFPLSVETGGISQSLSRIVRPVSPLPSRKQAFLAGPGFRSRSNRCEHGFDRFSGFGGQNPRVIHYWHQGHTLAVSCDLAGELAICRFA